MLLCGGSIVTLITIISKQGKAGFKKNREKSKVKDLKNIMQDQIDLAVDSFPFIFRLFY